MPCWQGVLSRDMEKYLEEGLEKKTKLDDLQSVEISRNVELKQELETYVEKQGIFREGTTLIEEIWQA
jgi:hypothetical protein